MHPVWALGMGVCGVTVPNVSVTEVSQGPSLSSFFLLTGINMDLGWTLKLVGSRP